MTSTAMEIPSQRRAVLRLGLPAVGEQFLNMLVGLVDTYLVGHLSQATLARLGYTSDIALSATGVANQISWIITTMFMAVALGCTVVVARFVGAGNPAEASRAMRQSLLVNAVIGVLALVLIGWLAPPLIGWLSNDPAVQQYSAAYLRVAAWGLPLAAILAAGNAALRGAGDARTPLIAMLVVNGINALLSLALVNGIGGSAGLGIQGAAIGAAVAQSCGGLLMLGILLRGRSGLRIGRFPRPHWPLIQRILRQGLPFAIEQFIFQVAIILMIRVLNGIDQVAFAAHNTIITIESISFLPGMGIAAAATTLVGQHMGAQDPQQARASGFTAFRIAALMMLTMGALFVAIPEVLLRLVVANNPALVAEAALPLRMVGFAQPALAASFVFSGALRGGGDPRWPLFSKVGSVWLLRLPLIWLTVYQLDMGLNGVWLAMCIDFGMQGMLAWWRFNQGRWQQARV